MNRSDAEASRSRRPTAQPHRGRSGSGGDRHRREHPGLQQSERQRARRAGRRRRAGGRRRSPATCCAPSMSMSPSSVNLVPGDQLDSLVGAYAKVRLVSGSLVTPQSVQATSLVGPGNSVVAIQVDEGALPVGLRERVPVQLVIPQAAGATAAATTDPTVDRRRRGGVADRHGERARPAVAVGRGRRWLGADRRRGRRRPCRTRRARRRVVRRSVRRSGRWGERGLRPDRGHRRTRRGRTTTTAVALAAAWPAEDEVVVLEVRPVGWLARGVDGHAGRSDAVDLRRRSFGVDDRRRIAARGVTSSRSSTGRVPGCVSSPRPARSREAARSIAEASISMLPVLDVVVRHGARRRRAAPGRADGHPGDPRQCDGHRRCPPAGSRLDRARHRFGSSDSSSRWNSSGCSTAQLHLAVIGDDPFDVDEIATYVASARLGRPSRAPRRSPSTRCRRWSWPVGPGSPPSGSADSRCCARSLPSPTSSGGDGVALGGTARSFEGAGTT